MKIHVNTINLKTRLRLLIISLTNTSFIVSVTILNPKVLVKCLWFVRSMSTHGQGNNFDPPRQVLDSYYERMSNVLLMICFKSSKQFKLLKNLLRSSDKLTRIPPPEVKLSSVFVKTS